MSTPTGGHRRKLNEDFDNVFREHDRLRQDLQSDQSEQYQSLVNSIDKWEQDAIKKIQKTAGNARKDAQRLLKDATHQLQHVLNDAVTESLREALEQQNSFTGFHIDRWLASLSEIRRQLETLPAIVNFSQEKVIHLIKVKQNFPLKMGTPMHLDHRQFNFETIRGRPVFYNTEHLIRSYRPATILSQNRYSNGTHYFRFRVEQATDELFFGIISGKDLPQLKANTPPIVSIHGWWNIDRRVVGGQKDSHVSTLNIYSGDMVILVINCDARQILLEYPSMTKLNSIQMIDDVRECAPPWRLLIEIGKPGTCLLKLLDWGTLAHGTDQPERRLHCFCSSDP